MNRIPASSSLRFLPYLPLAVLLALGCLAAFPVAAAAQPYAPPDRLEAEAAELERTAEAGGWTRVPEGEVLREGATGERVTAVRRRLAEAGLLEDPGGSDEYTAEVVSAVERFQELHGIVVDGLVGPETRGAMNVSAAERAAQAKRSAELQRRFLSEHGEASYILVNVPDFRLKLLESGSPTMEMDVIVGREGWGTPELDETLEYLVVNPDWDVPASIVAADIAPKVAEDPGYLDENAMVIYESWEPGAGEVDPSTIDWSSVTEEGWGYRLQQVPGPENPLGRIKFMFPNDHDVYLHGTPAEQLFEKDLRGLSHGCIRVERPVDLAARVLAMTGSDWDRSRLERAVASEEQQRVDLPETLPVHLVYWTAFVDADGQLNFRKDIYDRRG